jgi:5-methylcytosine-specific restriction endonuclease McrA
MDCLVLSPAYEPINQVSWEKAIEYLWKGTVEVLEEYDDWTVRSPSRIWKVPAVVRFLQGALGRKRGVRFSRENVYTRDKGRCQYCGVAVPRLEMTFDHVVPRALGGKTRWENVVVACWPCNQKKQNRTVTGAKMRLLHVPEKPKSLPETISLHLNKARAEKWKAYVRDLAYWHSSLESD